MVAADTNPKLGREVHELLKSYNVETPFSPEVDVLRPSDIFQSSIQLNMDGILGVLGLDLEDDSLKNTSKRVAKMYTEEIFYGLSYANFPNISAFENKAQYDEMLAVSCTVNSFCEHHLLPFIGVAHVAYIPGSKFLGLSKFNRVVDFFSRRPQVQERLTEQLSRTLQYLVDTEDVAVVIKAKHFCVQLRGVKDPCGETVTSRLTGKFRNVDALRHEFLALTR